MRQRVLNGIQDAISSQIEKQGEQKEKEKDDKDDKKSDGSESKIKSDGTNIKDDENDKGAITTTTKKKVVDFLWETAARDKEEDTKQDPKTQSLSLLIATSMGVSTSLLSAFDVNTQRMVAIESISMSLLEIYSSFMLQNEDNDKSDIGGDTAASRLLSGTPFATCKSGSPLDIALNNIEKVMKEYWQLILDDLKSFHPSDPLNLFHKTIGAANASISFLLAIALFRNSLSGLLYVVEMLLYFPELRLVEQTTPFWQKLVGGDAASLDSQSSNDNSLLAEEILKAVESMSKENPLLFPIASMKDAAQIVFLICTFGCSELPHEMFKDKNVTWSDKAWNNRNILCARAANLLQVNVTRVMPTLPATSREQILGPVLGSQLKDHIESMLQDASRDPSTDIAIAKCILLFSCVKDVLIPDPSKQFTVAGELLTASLSHDALTPGQRSLGAALMHELTGSNLLDMLVHANPDTLIQALLSLLDQALEKEVKLLVIDRNLDADEDSEQQQKGNNSTEEERRHDEFCRKLIYLKF